MDDHPISIRQRRTGMSDRGHTGCACTSTER
jgi:hypothetical protein